jgi:hypothetical protein
MSTPTIKSSANIAILWGTENATNNTAGFKLETLTITPKNSDPVDIEDGDGFTAVQVGLKDGFNAKGTGLYDSNRALPAEGANVQLVIPKSDGNAGTQVINCTFWSFGFTRSRKKEAIIELNLTHRPNLNT